METKITVASALINGDWCNIKTDTGKEISAMLSRCPKLKAIVETNPAIPYELTIKLVEKNGKFYAWDLDEAKEKTGGKFAPKNEKAIIAQSSYGYALEQRSGFPYDEAATFALAEKIFSWVCKKGGINESN